MPARVHNAEEVALNLTLAVVRSSLAPLLLLDDHFTVIAASASFCEAFEARPADLTGQALYAVGAGEWDTPALRALLAATVSGDAPEGPHELDIKRPHHRPRHLIVQATRLDYLDLAQSRILVAVSDVTAARADAALKEEALRQNGVLLQEVRHRVANSLQIIASVLLQNARKSNSEETRGHLKDAHQRVMSVAALERMLSTSQDGAVELHAYFTTFCAIIASSLIGDPDQISLVVEGGDGVVDPRVSVSLGLIVSELVINALKYAFPDGRPGTIWVGYDVHGPGWALWVRDDGVGMPPPGPAVRTGLGTSIVQALAGQLDASVEIGAEHPGTRVYIKHDPIDEAQDEPATVGGGPAVDTPVPVAIGV